MQLIKPVYPLYWGKGGTIGPPMTYLDSEPFPVRQWDWHGGAMIVCVAIAFMTIRHCEQNEIHTSWKYRLVRRVAVSVSSLILSSGYSLFMFSCVCRCFLPLPKNMQIRWTCILNVCTYVWDSCPIQCVFPPCTQCSLDSRSTMTRVKWLFKMIEWMSIEHCSS